MTQAQIDARERVKQILSEHFEGWVLVVRGEEDDHHDYTETCYDGGFAQAIGLLRIGERRINQTCIAPPREDDNEP